MRLLKAIIACQARRQGNFFFVPFREAITAQNVAEQLLYAC